MKRKSLLLILPAAAALALAGCTVNPEGGKVNPVEPTPGPVEDVHVTSISSKTSESKPLLMVTEGATKDLKKQVEFTPANATNKGLTFEVEDEDVVEVDEEGIATPVAVGYTTVTATSKDNPEASCVIHISVSDGDEPGPGPVVEGYGTEDAPLTATQALAVMTADCTSDGTLTKQAIYCQAEIKEVKNKFDYDPDGGNGVKDCFELVVTDGTSDVHVYRLHIDEADEPSIVVGKTIKFVGYAKNYKGELEFVDNGAANQCHLLSIAGEEKVVASISNAHGPATVKQNGSIAASLVTVDVSYEDGSTATGIHPSSVQVDSSRLGSATVTVTLGGKTTTFTVEVVEGSNYGSETSPLSASQALAIMQEECVSDGNMTAQAIYCQGTISEIKNSFDYIPQEKNGVMDCFELMVTDGTSTVYVYRMHCDEAVTPSIAVGKTIKFVGFAKNFKGTLEFVDNSNANQCHLLSVVEEEKTVSGITGVTGPATIVKDGTLDLTKVLCAVTYVEGGTGVKNPETVDLDVSSIGVKTATAHIGSYTGTFQIEVVEGDQPIGQGAFHLVKSTADVVEGTYAIADGDKVFNGLDVVNGYTTESLSGEVIAKSDTIVTVKLEAMEGGFAIKVLSGEKEGQYISGKSGDNALVFTSDKQLNTIDVAEDGKATIVSNTSILKFNTTSNQLRFRYYKSANTDAKMELVQLYKFEESVTPVEQKLDSVVVKQGPTKSSYTAGESFDPAGLVLTAKYTGGKADAEISDVSKFSFSTAALVEGATSIQVSYTEGDVTKSVSVPITVTGGSVTPSVTKVELNAASKELEVGGTFTLVATVTKVGEISDAVTWESSNSAKVTVENGVITGVTATEAQEVVTITATSVGDPSKSATCSVTVKAAKVIEVESEYSVTLSSLGLAESASGYYSSDKGDICYADVGTFSKPEMQLKASSGNVYNKYAFSKEIKKVEFTITKIAGANTTAKMSFGSSADLGEDIAIGKDTSYSLSTAGSFELVPSAGSKYFSYVGGTGAAYVTEMKFVFDSETPVEQKLDALELKQGPSKTEYEIGDEFNPTGLQLTASYTGGKESATIEPTTAGFDFDKTPVVEGQTKVVVSYTEGGVTKECEVPITVKEAGQQTVDVTGVTLDKEELAMTVGDEDVTLVATVAPSDASNKNISWSTSAASVATVTNGVVHAVGEGEATITVTTEDQGKTATCVVTVSKATAAKGTLENPYTVAELLEAYKDLPVYDGSSDAGKNNCFSNERVYVQGLITGDAPSTPQYTLEGDLVVYKPAAPSSFERPCKGDVAIFEGYVEHYTTAYELASNANHDGVPTCANIVSRGTSTVELDDNSSANATVTFEKSVINAADYSFTVAAKEGNQVSCVKIFDTIRKDGAVLEGAEGVYSTKIYGNAKILVETLEAGQKVPTTVSKTIAEIATANGWQNEKQYSSITLDSVISASCTTGTNTGKYYTSDNTWRMYANEGAKVTITAAAGYTIQKVIITYANKDNGVLIVNDSQVASGTAIENINATSLIISAGSTSGSKGKVNIKSIEVVYIAD